MDLVLSIKEEYYQLIISKKKKYEYRFKFPKVEPSTRIYLYVAKTLKAIVGYLQVSESKWMSKEIACQFYAEQNPDEIGGYQNMSWWIGEHQGCYALKIGTIQQFEKPLTLDYLRQKYEFVVPQNYCYLKNPALIAEFNSLTKEFIFSEKFCWFEID